MADEQQVREDTMLYREPTDESDEAAVQDIWGKKLETRVVDASEVPALLNDGWVRNPLDLGKKPEERAGFERMPRTSDPSADALAAAEKLASELGEKVKSLTEERDVANERVKALETDLSAEKALRASSAEHIRRLEEETKELRKAAKPKPA